jgi:LuxR family transcriptional regulator, glucitol operon activator
MMSMPQSTAGLIRLLREKLQEGEARDIGNHFGQKVEQKIRYYDRLPGDGFDARVAALVERAEQLGSLPELLQLVLQWRGDLDDEIRNVLSAEPVLELKPRSNLPPRHGEFLGRKEDLARVLEGLSSRYPLVSIEGIGGIGKTSLAVEVGYAGLIGTASAEQPVWEYVVWVSARDQLERKRWLDEVLNTIAIVLNYFSITQLQPDQSARKQMEIDRLLRGQRVLIIIDNFETIDDPDLVAWMERVPEPSHILITTRQSRLQKTWAVHLTGLDGHAALALIRQVAKARGLTFLDHQADGTLLSLVEVTDGNPRAIEMALGCLWEGMLSIDELVNQLRDAGESVEDIFGYLFTQSWKALAPNAKKILLVVPLFVGSIAKDALRKVSGLPSFDFAQAVSQLVNTNLLDLDHASQRYSVHPMTRAFAKKQLASQPDLEEQARERWSSYYLDFVRSHTVREAPSIAYWNALVNDQMTALDAEWYSIEELLAWADRAGRSALLLELVTYLVHYMDSRFHNLERLTYVVKAIDAAKKVENPVLEAWLRIDALGWTCVEENRLDQAHQEIQLGLEVAQTLPPGDKDALDLIALGTGWLARLRLEEGLVAEATDLMAEALSTPCRAWIKYRLNMAAGDIALRLGQGDRALQSYQEAVSEYEQYGGEGHGYQIDPKIGLAEVARGNLEGAEKKFEAVRAHEGIAIGKLYADYGMALVAYRRGEIEKARRLAETARQRLSRQTSSNLLLTMIDNLFEDLKASNHQ